MDKKTATITIKTTAETRARLEKIAEEKDWTLSKVCDKIIQAYLSDTRKK